MSQPIEVFVEIHNGVPVTARASVPDVTIQFLQSDKDADEAEKTEDSDLRETMNGKCPHPVNW